MVVQFSLNQILQGPKGVGGGGGRLVGSLIRFDHVESKKSVLPALGRVGHTHCKRQYLHAYSFPRPRTYTHTHRSPRSQTRKPTSQSRPGNSHAAASHGSTPTAFLSRDIFALSPHHQRMRRTNNTSAPRLVRHRHKIPSPALPTSGVRPAYLLLHTSSYAPLLVHDSSGVIHGEF